MPKYKVLRRHQGDRFYEEGEVREARAGDVAHLVDRGVLAKDEPAAKNKAEPAARTKATK